MVRMVWEGCLLEYQLLDERPLAHTAREAIEGHVAAALGTRPGGAGVVEPQQASVCGGAEEL